MSNLIIIVLIIILLYLFSKEKDLANKIKENKVFIGLIVFFVILNNLSLAIILAVLLFFILSNNDIRNKLYNRYKPMISRYQGELNKLIKNSQEYIDTSIEDNIS